MSACPDKELLLHALIDNELDAGHALEIEAHAAACPGCGAELAGLRELKHVLAASPLAYPAPPGLRPRLEAALAKERAPAQPKRGRFGTETWALTGAIGALAASLVLFSLAPTGASLESQLVEAQARSLQAQHLTDVPTSNRHVVKPWFNGKIDFAPPVADLVGDGYPLVGGRLDHVGGRAAAALVFRRRAHVINLFMWPGDAPAAPSTQRLEGYNLVRWGRGGLVFWAVSDVDAGDLQGFQRAFVKATG
jgi:anti-sigma factor RsiW